MLWVRLVMSSPSASETVFPPQVSEWKVKELQLNLVGLLGHLLRKTEVIYPLVRAVPLVSKRKQISHLLTLVLSYFPFPLTEGKLEHWAVTTAIHPQIQSVALFRTPIMPFQVPPTGCFFQDLQHDLAGIRASPVLALPSCLKGKGKIPARCVSALFQTFHVT